MRPKTFAHVLVAQEGYTSAYRDVTGVTEPTTVLTFRSSGDELLALVNAGPPFYRPPWSPTVIGMVLDDDTDWDEVTELVTDSYRFCAPWSCGVSSTTERAVGRFIPGGLVADFADTTSAQEAYAALKEVEDGRHVEIEGVISRARSSHGSETSEKRNPAGGARRTPARRRSMTTPV